MSQSVNSEASKSLTVDTVCNISEYEELEVVAPRDNTGLARSCRDIPPLAEPELSNSESVGENYYKKSQTENIKEVSETNNSVLSAAVTEVSSFYDISYCSKV